MKWVKEKFLVPKCFSCIPPQTPTREIEASFVHLASPLSSKRKGESINSGPAAGDWRKETKSRSKNGIFKGRSKVLFQERRKTIGKSKRVQGGNVKVFQLTLEERFSRDWLESVGRESALLEAEEV